MPKQHTPGPWVSENEGNGRFSISASGKTRYIASCTFGLNYNLNGEIMPSEAEANARLIAAAPDLLKVLENILEAAEFETEWELGPEIIEAASAAITKATGGQTND